MTLGIVVWVTENSVTSLIVKGSKRVRIRAFSIFSISEDGPPAARTDAVHGLTRKNTILKKREKKRTFMSNTRLFIELFELVYSETTLHHKPSPIHSRKFYFVPFWFYLSVSSNQSTRQCIRNGMTRSIKKKYQKVYIFKKIPKLTKFCFCSGNRLLVCRQCMRVIYRCRPHWRIRKVQAIELSRSRLTLPFETLRQNGQFMKTK